MTSSARCAPATVAPGTPDVCRPRQRAGPRIGTSEDEETSAAVGETGSAASPRPDWRALIAGAGLDEREFRAACRRRRYARGETIVHEGDPASALHLLDVGHVEIRLTTTFSFW